MRILGCLDGTNSEQIQRAINTLVNSSEAVIGLIYVIDTRPRDEIGRKRSQLLRPLRSPGPQEERIEAAELAAAQDIFYESKINLSRAETIQRQGRPELEIVNTAAAWNADLIVIGTRSFQHLAPAIGPKSVGHIARFVLDHAPCPVLLVRPADSHGFPIVR
ncbi:hypothetical protein KDH_18150 [Dictyobacter sp. S3.2.2.5]|uniref:UspA domain-containing protein n=1 Tax=Dictyobacter halimunensis TaxID=3026934 RepID=A0ABQ6FR88_9CHLR|nr:hypothetical protein KDH_18150 [Dictyobacter sp. S3.2.2.5]